MDDDTCWPPDCDAASSSTIASDPELVLQLQLRLDQAEAENRSLRAYIDSKRALLEQLQRAALLEAAEGGAGHPRPAEGAAGDGEHPLLVAVRAGNAHVAGLLLNGGADARMAHNAPLLIACQNGHTELARLLLERGADVHVDHDSPLLWAVRRGDAEMTQLLLSRSARPDALQGCAMRLAVQLGHADIVQLLLIHGCRV